MATNNPQFETFGKSEAEERFCLDMCMVVGDHSHDLKVKVYNTTCALDVQVVKDEVHKVVEHLRNKTVGEYFANIIIPKVVEYIEKNVNIKALNELYMKLARDGYNNTKKTKPTCPSCKSNSQGAVLKCKYCKRVTHEKCASKYISAESLQMKLSNLGTFQLYFLLLVELSHRVFYKEVVKLVYEPYAIVCTCL